ncbi:hypothetical protein [Synechococcus sp. CS-1328]|uniref:hypothetical protein n=1 Tax=Synechococcus sp. CS-1328 TaxID=2847976 RepID=UPI00223C52B9|nr:hypothetical protein [Synechococcus sp. CS-1328]
MAPRSNGPSPATTPSAQSSGDVLVSAVISPYLLTHLHHVLQRAEFGARQDGQSTLAANYAQLRQVLCQEARSLKGETADNDAHP